MYGKENSKFHLSNHSAGFSKYSIYCDYKVQWEGGVLCPVTQEVKMLWQEKLALPESIKRSTAKQHRTCENVVMLLR